jgi:hydroxymethylglutaryl-CoA lyase
MLPRRIDIVEVGPREGVQSEVEIPTSEKIRLVDMLSDCGFREIQVTSFVNPKWVPQMADADRVAAGFQRRAGVRYSCIALNKQGVIRAQAAKKFDLEGMLLFSVSDTFSRKNMNRSISEIVATYGDTIDLFRSFDIPTNRVSAMAVFGCNYEGDIEQENVIRLLRVAVDAAGDRGEKITSIQLCDTMGWANPQSIKRMVGGVREAWPDAKINLHLHDTRGMAIANAFAALELGVDEFDAAVGGLGGCPYGGFKGAAGNIVTEDFVHLCEEIGIETGIDLERLLAVSREAQTIFGHPLPSKTISGGALESYRTASGAASPSADQPDR